jgi:hypothetical protein
MPFYKSRDIRVVGEFDVSIAFRGIVALQCYIENLPLPLYELAKPLSYSPLSSRSTYSCR